MGLGTGLQLSSGEKSTKTKIYKEKNQKRQKDINGDGGQTALHGFGNWLAAFRKHQQNRKDIKKKKTKRAKKQILFFESHLKVAGYH